MWFKQTIGNACGLYGLIHATCNGMTRDLIGKFSRHFSILGADLYPIAPSTVFSNIITKALPLEPQARTKVIETNKDLATAHASAAAGGDTVAPSADDKIDLHYVAFIKTEKNNLWELDGGRKGPLNRGKLENDEDILSEKAVELGPKRFLKREEEAGGGEMRFSILALGPGLD